MIGLIVILIIIIALCTLWLREYSAANAAADADTVWNTVVGDREIALVGDPEGAEFTEDGIIWPEKRWDEIESMMLPHSRTITLHYTEWCPACKNIKPIWDAAKASLSDRMKFIELDEDIVKTEGIMGYPTIRLVDERGVRRQYNGPADLVTLRNWMLEQ